MADFQVKRLSKTVVAADLPPQEHWLQKSNLDLLLRVKLEMNTFFCYRKPPAHTFGSSVNVLKEALSQTLVPYYAFAGEMVMNIAGEPELLCNNRGVDFVEAYAGVELRELNLYKPEESIDGKLVPTLENGVLAVQVTELSCGGVVVGCTFDHQVADAYSANMFWKSWAEMPQSKPLSCLPSFRRSLLSPRRPGNFDPSITKLCVPISKLQPPETQPPAIISRIYSVPAEQIHNLQLLANHENPSSLMRKRTKIEAFSAFLWKLIASGTNAGENFCWLGIAVDGRTRIVSRKMCNYFGNLVSYSFEKKKNKELEEMPLSSIANDVHKFLDVAMREDHFLGLIDYVEAHRPELVVGKMLEAKVSKEEPALMVSSGQGFPIAKMDFGWGPPVFGSNLWPSGMEYSYVMPMPSMSENGDWVVYTCLPEDQIELIENTAAHIFKPFTLG